MTQSENCPTKMGERKFFETFLTSCTCTIDLGIVCKFYFYYQENLSELMNFSFS